MTVDRQPAGPPGPVPCGPEALNQVFGQIDVYLFDQLLKGRITPAMRILDAGCGGGRNLHYLMRCECRIWGVDRDAAAIDRLQAHGEPGRFRVAELDDLPFADHAFDGVVCSAVLHFAEHEAHFARMVDEMWRVLVPGGIFFARLASTIGVEAVIRPLADRRFALPDGTDRFLVDRDLLEKTRERLNGRLLDPLKTTNVDDRRAMTTWVLEKAGVD